jgi:peptide-methionine (S)-S-oxide reductase
MESALFAAGCFWGVEEAFRTLNGVSATAVGYCGGTADNPNYKQVCTGTTGHAEAVRVDFDPSVISYDDLLNVFWECHDPTTLNRQGPDRGTQYRSAIFFQNQDQEKKATASRDRLEQSGKLNSPIVTQIVKAQTFWLAEDYHQQYIKKNGLNVCH